MEGNSGLGDRALGEISIGENRVKRKYHLQKENFRIYFHK